MSFHNVYIIYNPNSTGDGKANALSLKQRLKKSSSSINVNIIPTKYAGHAEELAKEYGRSAKTVIISSSGDGGYNEVVNGVLKSKGKAAMAVLPSGNANDHYNAIKSNDLVENIIAGETRLIEAIRVQSMVDGEKWERYAHSYVGFGITPKIGKELTIRQLNAFNEKWHTLYHLIKFKHVDLSRNKIVTRYSSLIFSTIKQMSKIIKLDDSTNHSDGMMEVYETTYRTPLQLLTVLLHASLRGLTKSERVKEYKLKTISPTMVQLDGEVFTLDKNADVTLECVPEALRTVL